MPDFIWKQGDQGPAITDTLQYSGGAPVPLAGSTVNFNLRSMTDGSALSTANHTLTGTISTTALNGSIMFSPSTADTSQPMGNYVADWDIILPWGATMHWPTEGLLWGRIEPSAESAPKLIVDIASVKEHLGIISQDRTKDGPLVTLVQAITPLIEQMTGPIAPKVYEEWHDGGANMIELRRIPSSGFGTTPILTLIAASEYRGPIEYPLSLVPSPAFGSIYSAMLDPDMGTITRRSAGGATLAFMPGRQSIHLFYQAGQSQTPPNVTFAALECVRIAREWTQQVGRGSLAVADGMEVGPALQGNLSRVIRMFLGPTRRAPAFA